MNNNQPKLPSVPIKRLNLIVPLPVYNEIQRLAAQETADPYEKPNISAMARKLLWVGLQHHNACLLGKTEEECGC
jgi:hypothetical protein